MNEYLSWCVLMFGNITCNNGPWKDAWSFLLENTSSNESLVSPFYSSSISAYSPYVTSPFVGSAAREKNQSSQLFFGADFSRKLYYVRNVFLNILFSFLRFSGFHCKH